jgi:hypothetical protein
VTAREMFGVTSQHFRLYARSSTNREKARGSVACPPLATASCVAYFPKQQVLLTRVRKWSWLKARAMNVAKRRGIRKATVTLVRRLAIIMHLTWSDGNGIRGDDSFCQPMERCPSRHDEPAEFGHGLVSTARHRSQSVLQIGPPCSSDPIVGGPPNRSRREE